MSALFADPECDDRRDAAKFNFYAAELYHRNRSSDLGDIKSKMTKCSAEIKKVNDEIHDLRDAIAIFKSQLVEIMNVSCVSTILFNLFILDM